MTTYLKGTLLEIASRIQPPASHLYPYLLGIKSEIEVLANALDDATDAPKFTVSVEKVNSWAQRVEPDAGSPIFENERRSGQWSERHEDRKALPRVGVYLGRDSVVVIELS